MAITTTDRSLASLKEEICDIGRRIYNKGFAAGNDGNISFRLNDKEVLCTPTQISKGFMKPSDLCMVDMDGNQVAGQRKRSSEILLHLTIMKDRPDVNSVVHCHPPTRNRVCGCSRANSSVRLTRGGSFSWRHPYYKI